MRQIIGASQLKTLPEAARRTNRCVGHFFDVAIHRIVDIDLGTVYIRPVFAFRSEDSWDEPKNVLSWDESSDQSAEYPSVQNGYSIRDERINPLLKLDIDQTSKVRVLCNTRTKCNGLPKSC